MNGKAQEKPEHTGHVEKYKEKQQYPFGWGTGEVKPSRMERRPKRTWRRQK